MDNEQTKQVLAVFGAPLDVLDDPQRINLKLASISARLRAESSGARFTTDPYSAFRQDLAAIFRPSEVTFVGQAPIPSWLTPVPTDKDVGFMDPIKHTRFLEGAGCRKIADAVGSFVEERVDSAFPFMIGVDHSLTGGIIRILSRRYSKLQVVVVDAHADFSDFCEASYEHCGNFLSVLLREQTLRPADLILMGVRERTLTPEARLWMDQGVQVLTAEAIEQGRELPMLTGPTYVSVDIDVGAFACVASARYMNCVGLDFVEILGIAQHIIQSLQRIREPLVGFDIMETDVHLLGAPLPSGRLDRTQELVVALTRLLHGALFDVHSPP